jgi:hypothetical protein
MYGSLRHVIERFLEAHREIPHFIPRDCRRAWKTLVTPACPRRCAICFRTTPKNRTSRARHYDRYDQLRERREAMERWGIYLELILTGKITEIGQRESNVVPIDRAAALASAGGADGRRALCGARRYVSISITVGILKSSLICGRCGPGKRTPTTLPILI